VKVLCYVNHYFGAPVGFHGRSTDADDGHRRAVVAACLEGLWQLPGAEVAVCGIEGSSLVDVDLDFPQVRDDPKLLVYESLAHMVPRIDDFDYFVNIEDDILLPETTLANVIEFDRTSLVDEILHPNRIEEDDTGRRFCVDLEAMPGWTYHRRTYQGREIREARNPHSAVLILSRAKLRYALQHIDVGYRGRFLTYEMDSALAYYLSPFSLYRPYEDLEFHTVTHLDRWAGLRATKPPPVPPAVRRPQSRWKAVVREITPPILLPNRRRKG
jgi:hypothetical protein